MNRNFSTIAALALGLIVVAAAFAGGYDGTAALLSDEESAVITVGADIAGENLDTTGPPPEPSLTGGGAVTLRGVPTDTSGATSIGGVDGSENASEALNGTVTPTKNVTADDNATVDVTASAGATGTPDANATGESNVTRQTNGTLAGNSTDAGTVALGANETDAPDETMVGEGMNDTFDGDGTTGTANTTDVGDTPRVENTTEAPDYTATDATSVASNDSDSSSAPDGEATESDAETTDPELPDLAE